MLLENCRKSISGCLKNISELSIHPIHQIGAGARAKRHTAHERSTDTSWS